MTRERHPQPELSAFDYAIRRYTNAANANRGLAEHFAEQAALDEQLRDYWLSERDRALALGGEALSNVIPFPQQEGDGAA